MWTEWFVFEESINAELLYFFVKSLGVLLVTNVLVYGLLIEFFKRDNEKNEIKNAEIAAAIQSGNVEQLSRALSSIPAKSSGVRLNHDIFEHAMEMNDPQIIKMILDNSIVLKQGKDVYSLWELAVFCRNIYRFCIQYIQIYFSSARIVMDYNLMLSVIRKVYRKTDGYHPITTFQSIERMEEELSLEFREVLLIGNNKTVEIFRILLSVFNLEDIIEDKDNSAYGYFYQQAARLNYDYLTCIVMQSQASDILALLWEEEAYRIFVNDKIDAFLNASLRYRDIYALRRGVSVAQRQEGMAASLANKAERIIMSSVNKSKELRILLNAQGVRKILSERMFSVDRLFRDHCHYASIELLVKLFNADMITEILERYANLSDAIVLCLDNRAFRHQAPLNLIQNALFQVAKGSDYNERQAWGLLNGRIFRGFLRKDEYHCTRLMQKVLAYSALMSLRQKFKDVLFNSRLAAIRGLSPCLPKELWERVAWFMWDLEGDPQVTNGLENRVIAMYKPKTTDNLKAVLGLNPDEDAPDLPQLAGPSGSSEYHEASEVLMGQVTRGYLENIA